MRLLLFILGVFAAVACFKKPAEAQDYPWCAYYGPEFGATNCGFAMSGFWLCFWARLHPPVIGASQQKAKS